MSRSLRGFKDPRVVQRKALLCKSLWPVRIGGATPEEHSPLPAPERRNYATFAPSIRRDDKPGASSAERVNDFETLTFGI
jgi:hypothetical protein